VHSRRQRSHRLQDQHCGGGEFQQIRTPTSRLRQLLSQGFVDVVLAYAVDRLSRNQIHIAVLLDDIEKVDATLEFVTEGLGNTPVGG
jgi:DNA invertase Pin-like site-specific DNA recombinase